MEVYEILTIALILIFGISGLVLTFLQQKGKVKAVLTDTPYDWHFASGGKIVLAATIMGTYMIYRYSIIASILFLAFFGITYLFIKFK